MLIFNPTPLNQFNLLNADMGPDLPTDFSEFQRL